MAVTYRAVLLVSPGQASWLQEQLRVIESKTELIVIAQPEQLYALPTNLDLVFIEGFTSTQLAEILSNLPPFLTKSPVIVVVDDEQVGLEALSCGAQDFLLRYQHSTTQIDHAIHAALTRQHRLTEANIATVNVLSQPQKMQKLAEFCQLLIDVVGEPISFEQNEAFYQRFLEHAVDIVPGAQAGSILLRREDGHYYYRAAVGFELEQLKQVSFSRTGLLLLDQELEHGAHLLYPPVSHNPAAERYLQTNGKRREDGVAVSLVVPVMLGGEIEVVIYLNNFENRNAFDAQAILLAQTFGRQLNMVLQRLKTQLEANHSGRFQALLSRLEFLLLEYDEQQGLSPVLTELLSKADLPIDFLLLSRRQKSGDFKVTLFANKLSDQNHDLGKLKHRLGEFFDAENSIVAQVGLSAQVLYLDDIRKEDAFKEIAAELPLATMLCYPIMLRGVTWGVLTLLSSQYGAFDWTSRALLEQLLRSIETVLLKQADRVALELQLQKMRTLVAASEVLRSTVSRREIYQRSAETVVQMTRASSGALLLLSSDKDSLEIVGNDREQGKSDLGLRLKRGQGLSWRAIDRAETIHITKLEHHPERYDPPDSEPVHELIASPLFDQQGEIIGVLGARAEGSAEPFEKQDLIFLEAIAQACGNALIRVELLEQSEREAQAYRSLANFGATIEEVNDVAHLMELGLQSLREQLGMDMVTYHDVRGKYCYPAEIWGDYPPELPGLRNRAPKLIGKGLTGLVAQLGEMVYVEDYRNWPQALPSYAALGLATQVVIPVKQHDEVVKVISISCFNRVVPLSEEQLTIAKNFVKRLENALERADNLREIKATREATLRALGITLERRDIETKGHTDRVVALALRLAKELALSDRQIEALRWGAYLHDIGKIAMPDSILFKPGKLTTEEFEVIKEHAAIGYEMCREIPFLPKETRQLVRSHHEQWAGGGYPDGLRNSEIPLLARIFSMVDFYDALISERPYKPAWDPLHVLHEMEARAGRQFDPDLVKVFVKIMRPQLQASSALL